MTSNDAETPRTAEEGVSRTFERTVEDGERRLTRTWASLLSTGFVGGLDVGIGVFALLVVREATGNLLLGALGFTTGFIALLLARSELFTENFLVPIAAAIARPALSWWSLLRLWGGTFVMNLLAGWVVMAMVVVAFPKLAPVAVESGAHAPQLGIGTESLAGGLLAGMVITLMTWMERGAESVVGKLAAVIPAAFLLAAGPLNHAVISALDMFGGLVAGAPFGYADAAGAIAWAALWNMIGGVGLVTVIRLVQVGPEKVSEEQERSS